MKTKFNYLIITIVLFALIAAACGREATAPPQIRQIATETSQEQPTATTTPETVSEEMDKA